MIDYETYCKIRDHRGRLGLSIEQTAQALGLHRQTVSTWSRRERYVQRTSRPRGSQLDPYKGQIVRWLEAHDLSAQQVFQRLREAGYQGGKTIVNSYVRQVRPPKQKAYLKLVFTQGECAQVDWGVYGSVAVGNTRRRLSFFVMVQCYSRQMYVEFTVAQTMEHFLGCHERAFAALGVPEKVMVDNLKSAVLRRLTGVAPVFNPRYLDYARHHNFKIVPCNVAAGNEKGRVESGVGYVKKNFLKGTEFTDFSAVNPAAQLWLNEIANVREHGETHRRPVDLFAEERKSLRRPNPNPYDLGRVLNVRASSQFRIALDTNRYSVPAKYANQRVIVKAYPERVCIYAQDQLIARHTRCYDRHLDREDPDHPKALLEQRENAREQRVMPRYLAISPKAQVYYEGLEARRFNARGHVRKIIALAEIYGDAACHRAIEDAIVFHAFSSESIAHLLESRARLKSPAASPLSLTRRSDLLDIELPEPDLSIYEVADDE
jgi:transposase